MSSCGYECGRPECHHVDMNVVAQNWIINEALLSQGWEFFLGGESTDTDLDQWVASFASRRYGSCNQHLAAAWGHLVRQNDTNDG